MVDVPRWIFVTLAAAVCVLMCATTVWFMYFSIRYAFDRKYRKEADADIESDGFGSHF